MAKDLYEILGVTKTTEKDEIKKKYKKLARKYHPDVNPGDKEAERKFKEISAAHAVLTDDEKRKLYDEFGDVALQTGFDAKRAREWRTAGAGARAGGFPGGGGGFEGFDWTESVGGGGTVNFEDLFGDLFGGRGRRGGGFRARGPEPGEDIEASLELDFMTAIKGGHTRISLEKPGADGNLARETIDVNVPAGVREGQRLRLAGLGAPGQRGAPAGDLYVRIHVQPHPFYKREGDDLHVEVPITVGEAVGGATVSFPTPSGDVELKVPPLTQSGRRFRLRGLGAATKQGKGDLYAKVVVHVPTQSADELRELAKKVDGFYSGNVRGFMKL
jgi:curved DNA-binding protein